MNLKYFNRQYYNITEKKTFTYLKLFIYSRTIQYMIIIQFYTFKIQLIIDIYYRNK